MIGPAALAEALGPWVDASELRALAQRPRRVALVGRTGAGKTSLVNRLTGQVRPIGLGGVTRAVDEVADGDRTWIDTPGIDDPDRALVQLGPVLDGADAVIWVLDGLQPATHTEREVVRALLPDGVPLAAVVSRADLLADEVSGVLERVAVHTGPLGAPTPIARDLRPRGDLDGSDLARLRGGPPGPRELAALDRALATARERLARVPPPLDPDALAQVLGVRARVRAALDPLLADPEGASVPELVLGFGPALRAAVDAWSAQVDENPALRWHAPGMPALPDLPVPDATLLDAVRLGASGRTSVARELRALAGSWASEAELRLAEWADGQRVDAGAHASWARAVRWVDPLR